MSTYKLSFFTLWGNFLLYKVFFVCIIRSNREVHNMSFTDKLDALMAEKGINKSVLSKESGIPYTTIAGFYTKGTDNVKLSTLKKLSSYLGCTIDYLADDEQSEPTTLAAHFDGDEYTESEMEEIKNFAEFVKNKRK